MNVIQLFEQGKRHIRLTQTEPWSPGNVPDEKKEIAELLRLAKRGQAMDWVSVKDNGFPETEGHYWIYDSHRGWQLKAKWKNNKWDILSNEPYTALTVVTHYMPLPPAPEVKP